MNWEAPLKNMREQFKEYVVKSGIKSLVLGVSGGIDSALVVALVRPVCDELKIPLIGRSLPNTTNKLDEMTRADMVGKAFCDDFDTITINDCVSKTLGACERKYSLKEDEKFNKIAEGNIKARTRMVHLYDLAYRNRGMVLSTDNLTELLLGFWTLHGDVGDYGLIQNLWKTEVYDLSNWLCDNELNEVKAQAIKACIGAVPTDGLGITNSDLDQLGATTYAEVDKILKTWLVEDIDSFSWDDVYFYPGRPEIYEDFLKYKESLKDHPVVQRNMRSEFKRNNPFNIPRRNIFPFVKEIYDGKGYPLEPI